MPSITPTTTSTPSTQSFITLEVVLTAYTYRLTLTAFSRTALAKRPGPRSMPAEQLAPEGILRITLDAWGGEETAQLLFGDALLDKGKLAAPTQLPLSAAADATAPAAALVVAPIEDVVLLAGQWAYNSPGVDFSAAARGRGVPPSSDTFLVQRGGLRGVCGGPLFAQRHAKRHAHALPRALCGHAGRGGAFGNPLQLGRPAATCWRPRASPKLRPRATSTPWRPFP